MSNLSNNPDQAPPQTQANVKEVSLSELTEILIKHFGYRDGLYEVGIQFNIAVGRVGVNAASQGPGALVTVGGIGIFKADQSSPAALDAAVVNPSKPKRVAAK